MLYKQIKNIKWNAIYEINDMNGMY
jgi:hypothetical protein